MDLTLQFIKEGKKTVFGFPGPRPPALISEPRPPAYPSPRPPKKKNATSSNSSYFKSSHYDHGLWVYGLFKPCWLTHPKCLCFKETTLLLNAHLSFFLVNFILCPSDKYIFRINKLVFGKFGSSIYCLNDQFRKSYLLFDTYILFNI